MRTLRFPILKELGLNESEAIIYELLLELGPKRPPELTEPSGIGRANVYAVITQLQKRGLVLVKEGKHQTVEAVDPSKLQDLLAYQVEKTRLLESSFSGTLAQLSSAFHLSTGKPAIQIYEGLEGAKTAIHASLKSKTEILTYLDIHALRGELAKINAKYVRQRVEQKIPKRILVANTSLAHAFFEQQHTPFTRVAFLDHYPERFSTAMEIYDDTVSYLTLSNEKLISILVHDVHIYQMQKQQFDYLWSLARDVRDYAATLADEE